MPHEGSSGAGPTHSPAAPAAGHRRNGSDSGCGATGAFWWPTRRRRPRASLRVFDETEASILSAVAATVRRDRARRSVGRAKSTTSSAESTLFSLSPIVVQREFTRLLHIFENGTTGLFTATGWTSFTAAGPSYPRGAAPRMADLADRALPDRFPGDEAALRRLLLLVARLVARDRVPRPAGHPRMSADGTIANLVRGGDLTANLQIDADVAIVGSGPGGSIAAYRLAAAWSP